MHAMPPTEESGATRALPLYCVSEADLAAWREARPAPERNWLAGTGFLAEWGKWSLLPDAAGASTGVVIGLGRQPPADSSAWFWLGAALSDRLPFGSYALSAASSDVQPLLRLGALRIET